LIRPRVRGTTFWLAGVALLSACGATSGVQLQDSPPNAPPARAGIRENPAEWDARLQEFLRRRPAAENDLRAQAMAYVELARDYRFAGRLDRATEACQKALEIWPDCPEANELAFELKKPTSDRR
jgi:tetratricopeptide (TPR) repeat protein